MPMGTTGANIVDTFAQLGRDRTRVRKGAIRPEITPEQIRGLLGDVATGVGVPFIDAARQAAQGNYGQAAVSGLLDAPPVKMAGMALAPLIGMVRKSAPMDEALRIAQKNAAKPVSKGGLGLPPDNTPMDRAKAMGFDVHGFHGTPKTMRGEGFDKSLVAKNDYGAIGQGVYVDPSEDASYANAIITLLGNQAGSNILPVMVRSGNVMNASELPAIYSAERSKAVTEGLRQKGIDSVMSFVEGKPNEMMVINPSHIRSRFAAFDPARINENNLLASLAALGIGLPVTAGLLSEQGYD